MINLLAVNYNTQAKLQRLAETLRNSTTEDTRNYRLFIADNSSTDGSIEWIKQNEHLFDGIQFNENIGYARACNNLALEFPAEIMGFLNADVWLTNQDCVDIEDAFLAHPEIAVLGPKQRDENNNVTHAGIFGRLTKPQHRGWKQHDPNDIFYRDNCQAITVSGSAYFVRQTDWEDLKNCLTYRQIDPESTGAFLNTQFYFEETWLSYHCHAHQKQVWYWGEVSMGHSWHASSPINSQIPAFQIAQPIFRRACDLHGIPHD